MLTAGLLGACNYEETFETVSVSIRLVYPANTIEPYKGVRVELKDARASIFVDSTDAEGIAHFRVPAGIYDVNSSSSYTSTEWKYFFNAYLNKVVISADSTNNLQLGLKMSKKKIRK
ncbi:hypothetical protein EJ73_01939 [Hoylesella shahii DSM 15611 = JCM 12083]|uniref:Uncharacterized protein n=2 Tax=Hoylesella shahii TaxID=228603 RepID=A0A318HRC9_9BACT|nr:hypothetical protein EJ73_01939 [Hoylesella shahii DSM 15611 = JCM 12083]